MPQKYKYESILKTFQYSKESYQIISDFLLSGDITNPDILLNVTKVSKEFGKIPKDWLRMPSTVSFIKALIQVKIEAEDKKFLRAFKKFLKTEKAIRRFSPNGKNIDFIDTLELLDNKQLQKLMKEIGMIIVKRGGNNRELTGTWINRDLAVKYAEWLDPKFSIWISQKILELVNDGVSWNEIRKQTKLDYKPLTDAIEKHIKPLYPKMDDNILYGQIANFINLRVKNQKAKEIREELNISENELTRDYFEKLELEQIEKVQIFAEILISQLKIFDFKTLKEMILKYDFSD
jgi:hypothetical protein